MANRIAVGCMFYFYYQDIVVLTSIFHFSNKKLMNTGPSISIYQWRGCAMDNFTGKIMANIS